ncbi:MAG TPA: radical SAM protein [Gemmatimonadaceae bacterium]|nr:radical SAM protein [Gemmatimonadaceae bacterium]
MRRTRARLDALRYQWRLYGGLRSANRLWSPKHDMAASPFPQAIQLQTINACQAACRMCPYPLFQDAFPRGRMDDALFDKVTSEIAGHPEVQAFIPMLQNEPFLDKRLFDMIGRFKEATGNRIGVELVTNGAFLTDDNIARIRAARLDVLDISLDALSRETYETIRIGLDYDEVLAGVERVVNADLPDTRVFVRLVRQRHNIAEAKAFARHWRKRGVPVFIYTANDRAGALGDYDADVRVPEESVTIGERAGRRIFRALMRHCPIPFAAAYILHDGTMLLCVHDWGRKEILGNVRDASIAELWNGPRMREIRQRVQKRDYTSLPACRDCSLWRDGYF